MEDTINQGQTPFSQTQEYDPPRIDPFLQIKAIVCKELLLLRSQKWVLMLRITLLLSLVYFYSQNYLFCPKVPFIISSFISIFEMYSYISSSTNDKLLKFRATFKLMGLQDTSYIMGNLIFKLFTSLIQLGLSLSLLTFQPLTYYSLFITPYHTVFFILTFEIYVFALICYFASVSELISDAKHSRELVSMLFALIFLVPIFSLTTDVSKVTDTTADYVMIFVSPMGTWNLICKWVFMKSTELTNLSVLLLVLILFVQMIIFSTLYLFLAGFIGFDSGVSRSPFSLSCIFNLFSRRRSQYDDEHRELLDLDVSVTSNTISSSSSPFQISNVSKLYGDFKALDGINLEIKRNEITSILGHNGAGKTTLINAIVGINSPTQGKIEFNGEDVYSAPEVLSGKVGYCTSHDVLYQELTVSEFMFFIAFIKGIQNPKREITDIAIACDLTQYMDTLTKNLSGGTKRRTSIACAVIGNPKILIMDEPSSGVDPQNRRQIWSLVKKLKSEQRVTILSTHHLEEAEFLAETVVIMERGKIKMTGSPQQIKGNFGLGLLIKIFNLESQNQWNEISSDINQIVQEVKIVENSITKKGQLSISIPLKYKSIFHKVVSIIENKNLKVEIFENSLEDAYMKLGEEFESEFLSQAEQEMIFSKRYKQTTIGVWKALTYRRFSMLFSDKIIIIKFFYAVLMPPLLIWVIQDGDSLSSEYIYFLPLALTLFFYLNITFFAHLPLQERLYRIRYFLKMFGVGTFTYYGNMLICDIIYTLTIVFLNFLVLFLLNFGNMSESVQDYNWRLISKIWLYTSQWGVTFVTQCYLFQNIISDKRSQIRLVNIFILGINIAPIPILAGFYVMIESFLTSQLSGSPLGSLSLSFKILIYSIYIFSPALGLGTILLYDTLIKEITQFKIFDGVDVFISDNFLVPAHISLIANPLIMMFFVILIDYFQNSISSHKLSLQSQDNSDNSNQSQAHVFGVNQRARNEESIKNQEILATTPNQDLPIQASKISKIYKNNEGLEFYALNKISMVLPPGCTLGLLGPNGAGKSTLFNILSTSQDCSGGRILLKGKPLTNFSPFFKLTGVCSQDNIVWDSLSVDSHLKFISLVYGVDKNTVYSWLKMVEMNNFRHLKPSQLSSGMQRKLCFIMSCMFNPDYKFMDEPTTGLDPFARKRFREILAAQKKYSSSSTILTTHSMKEAEIASDKIVILVNGQICIVENIEDLKEQISSYKLEITKDNINYQKGTDYFRQLETIFGQSTDNHLRIVNVSGNVIDYNVEYISNIAEKLEKLEDMVASGIIRNYSLRKKNLEDLFLVLAGSQISRQN